MNLSEISIRRPVFAWMLMAGLIVFGALSFKQLGVSQLPDVDSPVVGVSVSLPGAAPEVVENQVIDPIEDAIMEIGGIKNVSSSASQSSGSISVEFELDRNIDVAVQDVQDRISQVRALLPATLLPPTVRKSNPEDQPILWIALTSDGTVSQTDMMIYARNYLYDQFGTVPGVGNIGLGGYVDPALRVWVDQDKLKKWNLTAPDVVNAITAEHVELPAGRIENSTNEYNVRLMGEAQNPADFGKIRIQNRSGLGANFKPIKISDLASVEEGTVDVRKISRFNGQAAVGLGILKQHGSNAVEVAQAIRAKLAEILPTIPKQYQISIRSDNTRFIKQSVDELDFMLLLSAFLTSLVCFFFLGSWASTINVLMAIPTSIVGSFMAIYFFGFTLNTFTLLGLSLAIGIVVDDAIMMLENIVRHQELGEKKKQAALKGSKEITFAALAATIAVVAIFLPVVFMKGVIGRYFYQYGVTVTAAVLLSLLEALTLTPMRCSQYLTIHHHNRGFAAAINVFFGHLAKSYQRILQVLLSHRWKTIIVTFALFGASITIAKHLPSEMILLRFKGPVGIALATTNAKLKLAEDYLQKLPETDGVFSMVGGFGGDAVNQGQVFLTLVDKNKRKRSQADIIKEIRPVLVKMLNPETAHEGHGGTPGAKHEKHEGSPIPSPAPTQAAGGGEKPAYGRGGGRGKGGSKDGFQVNVQDLSLKGFAPSRGFPVEFIVQGPDWDELTNQTNKVMEAVTNSGVVTDVNTDIQPSMQEIKIVPNREKLSKRGVALTTVTSAVSTLVGGALLNGQTEYPKAGHRYEIEVRLIASQRDKSLQLNDIQVRNNRGEAVPLSELVDLEQKPALQTISRLNRARSITVYGNPTPGHSQQEALKVVQDIGKKILPPGYLLKLTGSSQNFKETFDSLIYALLLGILVSYMVLASQFNSFIHPVTVLLALPFSISGAFIGLWVGHQSINVYSMIGFILLMGIVKKNSILLVDFTNQCRHEGQDVRSALLHACPIRLRPILMTSVATVAGALPEALSIGPGAETTIPMAIAIIGGVIASTILTLFVVPCAYSLFTKLERPDHLAAEI